MIEIKCLDKYDKGVATEMGLLLTQLSSRYDGSPVGREWLEGVIESPFHEQLVAFDDAGKLVGMATLTVVMGAKILRNAYLEDFVVDAECRGQGLGTRMWKAMLGWAREKGCRRFEFTASGSERKAGAVQFYLKMGAEIYDTNFFRVEIDN